MSHIFLSYSLQDEELVSELREELENNGFTVWNYRTLSPGESWEHAIDRAINNAVGFIVALTPNTKESDWVEYEVSKAQEADKPIIPVLVSGDLAEAVPSYLDVEHPLKLHERDTINRIIEQLLETEKE